MLKQQINITNQCYLSAADILCNGYESQSSRSFMACLSHAYTCDRDLSCAGNTNDFVTSRRNPTSGRTEIIVTLCQSTCLLFYNACSSWAKIRGYSKAADFCANFTHSDLLAFSDDEDYYGDVVYRVARNDRNCYLGEGIRSGLSIIEAQVGRCIPPLGYVAFLVLLLPPHYQAAHSDWHMQNQGTTQEGVSATEPEQAPHAGTAVALQHRASDRVESVHGIVGLDSRSGEHAVGQPGRVGRVHGVVVVVHHHDVRPVVRSIQ